MLWREWRIHVGLDFGGGEGAIVDTDLIDEALEVLAVGTVAPDPQGAERCLNGAGAGFARDLGPVDIEPELAAAVGEGDVGPGVEGGGEGAGQRIDRAPECSATGGLEGRRAAGIEEVGVDLSLQDGAPAALGGGGKDPGGQGHGGAEVEGGGRRDLDETADAIEAES